MVIMFLLIQHQVIYEFFFTNTEIRKISAPITKVLITVGSDKSEFSRTWFFMEGCI